MTIAGAGPLYVQVRNLMVERIRRGEYKPGEPIPSETRLARDLDVSQGTIRKAIGDLVTGRVLVRQQGKGTFVAAHDSRRALFHFFHVVPDQGTKSLPDSRTLSIRRREATRDEAAALALSAGGEVVRIERIRRLGGEEILAETISVPARMFPGLENTAAPDLPNAVYEMYERRFGVTIHRADERLKAVKAGQRIARQLGVDPGEALLRIERTARTLAGEPVELRVTHVYTLRHHYANTLT